ncbi:MAG: glucose-6-phosphate isomerase [Gammaproteobacteria bacterium]|nr:glucose-6-phosphate isomerase [Gammaproteobacteria bacterium]
MKPTLSPLLSELEQRAAKHAELSITRLFEWEPDRLQRMSAAAAGITLDFSKQCLDRGTLDLLGRLADSAGVAAARDAMLAGDIVNPTEQRAVLHTALRAPGGAAHARLVSEVQERMAALVEATADGELLGATGARFTDVVNIGIGGSHLGPQLACDALRYQADGPLRCHFLANVDGGEFDRITAGLDPRSTLFIIASKSFTTAETRLNAHSARAWLSAALGVDADVGRHFVAVTANTERAVEFGIDAGRVYPMWDWVGGRYSMWSAIGLPIALGAGMVAFRELLAGAAEMDQHFATASTLANLPMLLGVIGVWNLNCLGAESYAVVPYDDRLRYLPDYLQQLEMESNGKRVGLDNAVLDHHTAAVTWGGLGTNAQHAFFQLLHQGTRFIPVDFVVALQHPAGRRAHHDALVANCFAQAEALMHGRRFDEAVDEHGIDLGRHRTTPGNRPSSMLVLDELTPRTLGALIALYEHKTLVQSVIWNINAFDQWGVELGKVLAADILAELDDPARTQRHDPSTAALIARYRASRGA